MPAAGYTDLYALLPFVRSYIQEFLRVHTRCCIRIHTPSVHIYMPAVPLIRPPRALRRHPRPIRTHKRTPVVNSHDPEASAQVGVEMLAVRVGGGQAFVVRLSSLAVGFDERGGRRWRWMWLNS